jgi:hypothetical protein
LFDKDLATGSDSKLAVCHNTFAGFYTLIDNNQISLTLAQTNGALLSGRVLLNDIDE